MTLVEKDGRLDLSRRLYLRGTGGGLLMGSSLGLIGEAFAQGGGGSLPKLPPFRHQTAVEQSAQEHLQRPRLSASEAVVRVACRLDIVTGMEMSAQRA